MVHLADTGRKIDGDPQCVGVVFTPVTRIGNIIHHAVWVEERHVADVLSWLPHVGHAMQWRIEVALGVTVDQNSITMGDYDRTADEISFGYDTQCADFAPELVIEPTPVEVVAATAAAAEIVADTPDRRGGGVGKHLSYSMNCEVIMTCIVADRDGIIMNDRMRSVRIRA